MSDVANTVQKLFKIKRDINKLDLPFPGYLVISTHGDNLEISEMGEETILQNTLDKDRNVRNAVISYIEKREVTGNMKYICAEVVGEKWLKPIISDLWLTQDIVPYFTEKYEVTEKARDNYVREVRQRFNTENLVHVALKPKNEVDVAELVTIDDYKRITHPDEFDYLVKQAEQFKGKKMVFINATPQGGGVALMRHAIIRLYRLLGVDAHWYVLYPLKEAFDITKQKFHNVLQAVAPEDTILTDREKQLYNNWIEDNIRQFGNVLDDADAIIIDDPQPVGFIPHIRKINPNAKIMYRSHIQIVGDLASTEGTPQRNTWIFIWDYAKESDLFIAHPMEQFIPKDVPHEMTVMMPATTDALDGLNKPMSPRQTDYYHKLFERICLENDQVPLDPKRPYIIQVARFDPSKGLPDVVESYRALIEKLNESGKKVLPQLVICGHGSIDDPDGAPIFNLTMEMIRSDRYKHLKDDIKVARIPSSDQILNALMREAKIALQLSTKEGFEVKVSEALMKSVPIVVYRAGGIPLQVKDGVSGFIVDVGDTEAVAQRLFELCTNDELYHTMRKGALENVNPETTTTANAIKWLWLSNELIEKGKIVGNRQNVIDMINESDS